MDRLALFFLYLAAINFAGLMAMAADKRRAQRGKWRIRESTFFVLGALGGALGVYAGMWTFRHKTRSSRFRLGIPSLILWDMLAVFLLYKWKGAI